MPDLEESVRDMEEKKKGVEKEIRMFDRLCQRSNVWLKNMATAEFSGILDVQAIVMRMAKEEKKIDITNGTKFRTLSVFRRHSRFMRNFSRYVQRERQRLEREA